MAAAGNAQNTPPVIVGIVVQQMRYDAIARYGKVMSDNGFKRIMYQGANCSNAYYEYMITEPAPGFATICTGANPCNHGIVANSWYDRVTKKYVQAVADNKYSAVGAEAETGKASPKQLLGTTIGDEMKLSNFKQSKVYSVSWNNYSAVIPAGRLGNAAFWFDEKSGKIISNTFYMDKLPGWVDDFNAQLLPDSYLDRGWFTLKNMSDYRASLPDNSFYELGINGKSTFPYDLRTMSAGKDFQLLRYTPYSNELIKEFVLQLIEREDIGKDEFTDLLMINFAAPGYASDVFGIRSVELEDIYIRLDNDISAILNKLDQKLGKGNYVVFLTADRGSADSPMFLKDMGMNGEDVDVQHFMTLLNAYLRALYGDEKWVEKYYNRQIYLNHLAIERQKLNIKEVSDMASQFLLEINGISTAIPSSALLGNHSLTGIWLQAGNSFNRKRSGDIIVNLNPGDREKTDSKEFSNSAQNSAFNHDTHVPLAFYGNGIKRQTISRRVSIADITPTLTTILRILSPDYASGSAIYEVIDN